MRTYTSNNITITYQEPVVWIGDSNIITIKSSIDTDKVGGEIIIRHPDGTATRTIRYLSELNRILFILDDALTALNDGNIGQYTIQVNVFKNGNLSFTRTFSFQLLQGKSFTNQSHGISRTLYIYDASELVKVQIYSPNNGAFHIGSDYLTLNRGLNQYNLSSHIENTGEYSFCLTDVPVQPIAVISGDVAKTPTVSTLFYTVTNASSSNESQGGDVWRYEETIFPVCYDLVFENVCWDYNFVELRYKDSDGCTRYLGGKIASETNKSTVTAYEYTDGSNVFRNIPRNYQEGTSRSLKIGFADIAKNAYPQDIMYSELVEMKMYNSEWWPIVLESDSITVKNEDYIDLELSIIISRD